MLLEVAAGYGALRCLTDLLAYLRRPQAGAQEVIPAPNIVPERDARGRFRSRQDMDFEPMGPLPTEITEFEMTIRGRTHSFR